MENQAPPQRFRHIAANIVILVTLVVIGLKWNPAHMNTAWLLIMVLMLAFMVIFSHGITGDWRSLLIDGRFRMSLSRLQLLSWTLLILSALLAAVYKNLGVDSPKPLEIIIPSELWVLMGISTASAISAPAVMANKRKVQPDAREKKAVRKAMKHQHIAVPDLDGVLLKNRRFKDARWGDLLKGDETGNAVSVDLGKIQMFFFSFIIIASYGIAVAKLLDGDGEISALPAVDEGMNVLLGISHTGYLANKAVAHSKPQEPQDDAPKPKAPAGQATDPEDEDA
jgi:hypothetical protein